MSEQLCPIHSIPMRRVVVDQPTMAYVTRLECPECERMKVIDAKWNDRRFTAAVAAMQGLLASKQSISTYEEAAAIEQATLAKYAIKQSDALLKELEK